MTKGKMSRLSLNNNGGFTVLELLISISIITAMVPVLLVVTFGFYSDLVRQSTRAQLTLESQNVLQIMTEQLRIATAVRNAPLQTDANPPGAGWATSDASNTFIVALPTVSTTGDYLIDADTNEPFETDTVVYQSGKQLRKRSIVDPDAVGERQPTSCPDALATSSCPPDGKLTENFKDLTFQFYDQDDVLTNDPLLARSVVISVTLEKVIAGDAVAATNSVRMTLRN